MSRKMVRFTLWVEVTDSDALWDAATASYIAESGERPPTQAELEQVHGTREEPDLSVCVQQLYDPGGSLGGTEIEQSEAELVSL